MNAYTRGLLEKCNEYRDKYCSFTELEKIDVDFTIFNLIQKVMGGNNFNFYDENVVKYFHDLIMNLENPHALIFFDHRILNANFNRANRDILIDDVNGNLVDLINKKMDLFINCGLTHQLEMDDRFLVKQYDLGNDILNCNCRHNIRDMIHSVLYLEDSLKRDGIEVNLLGKILNGLSVEQLAFIYAQLSSLEIGVESSFDIEGREEIYKIMNCHSNEDKIEFIKTVCLLGYCNNAEGISAMLMDMYKKDGSEVASRSLYSLMIGDNKRKYGLESDYVFLLLDYSNRANKIRGEEISSGVSVDTVSGYLNKAYKSFNHK